MEKADAFPVLMKVVASMAWPQNRINSISEEKGLAELFEQTVLKGMPLDNRFVRSARWEGLATADGLATESLANLLVDLVRDNAGLIITGQT